jgi:hypothetical protein
VLRDQVKSSVSKQEDLLIQIRSLEIEVTKLRKEKDFEQMKATDLERLLDAKNKGSIIVNFFLDY